MKKAIALASRMDSEKAIKLAKRIFEFLVKKGEVVYLETRLAPKIYPHQGKDLSSMTNDEIKVVISIGGDGSILRVTSSLPHQDCPPLIGVNIGSIGFLDESSERNIFKDLTRILNEEYTIEAFNKIAAYVIKKNSDEIKVGDALNEVLIVSSKSSKVIQISVSVNGIFLNRSYLDGLIISTSTGSTAYNLSAGGAIVSPKLQVMQITPVNSFAGAGLKPLILPIDSEIEVKLNRPRLNAKIVIDGQRIIKKITPNSIIKIRKSTSQIKFLRLTKDSTDSYFRHLRKKIIGNVPRTPFEDSPEE